MQTIQAEIIQILDEVLRDILADEKIKDEGLMIQIQKQRLLTSMIRSKLQP